jgi:hypothetical protein
MNNASCVGLLAAKPPEVKATKVGGTLKVTDYMPAPFQAVSASSKLNAANNWPAASSRCNILRPEPSRPSAREPVRGYQESIQLSGAYATRQNKLKKRREKEGNRPS